MAWLLGIAAVALSGALIAGQVFMGLSIHRLFSTFRQYLVEVQAPATALHEAVASMESSLKSRMETVEEVVWERLKKAETLADSADSAFGKARRTEERIRHKVRQLDEAEEEAASQVPPWEAVEEPVAPQPAMSAAAFAFSKRRR